MDSNIDKINSLIKRIELIEYELNDISYSNYNKIEEIKNILTDIKKDIFFNKENNECICEHEFEKDLIDIDPDTSREIEYCTKCSFTKHY